MARYTYSWAQALSESWSPFWRRVFGIPDWIPPETPYVADRFLDTRRAVASEPVSWASEIGPVPVRITNHSNVWQGSLPGIPIQVVPAANRRSVTLLESNPYLGTVRNVSIPLPTEGEFWVEGNPSASGAWDRHVLLVCPESGEAWELIGYDPVGPRCIAASYWLDGKLIDGMEVYAGGSYENAPMSSILLNRYDPPHRLGLAFNDYIGHDGTKAEESGWPRCGEVLRLSEFAAARLASNATVPEQRTFVTSAREYGFLVYDRGGSPAVPRIHLGQTAGRQWNGTPLSLPGLAFTLNDLERVTEDA